MKNVLNELVVRYPGLASIREQIQLASDLLMDCFTFGNKLLICGNGGSCADGGHIVGELMKGFMLPRPLSPELVAALRAAGGADIGDKLQEGLPAISLNAHEALISAVANDLGADLIYAQQVIALGRSGDVLIGLSTSGNAQNVCMAAITAHALGMKVIAMTGASGGSLAEHADVLINVPETQTYPVQELHLPVYHALCAMVEMASFGKGV